IVGGGLCVACGYAWIPLPACGIGVVQRVVADLERADMPAQVIQRELLTADDLPRDRAGRALQGQAGINGQLVALAAGGAGDAPAAAEDRDQRGYGEQRGRRLAEPARPHLRSGAAAGQ